MRTRSAASTASRRSARGHASATSRPRWAQRPASSNSAHDSGRDDDGGAVRRTRNVFIGDASAECAAVYPSGHRGLRVSFQRLPDDRRPRALAALEQCARLRPRIALTRNHRDEKVIALHVEAGLVHEHRALQNSRAEIARDIGERLLSRMPVVRQR